MQPPHDVRSYHVIQFCEAIEAMFPKPLVNHYSCHVPVTPQNQLLFHTDVGLQNSAVHIKARQVVSLKGPLQRHCSLFLYRATARNWHLVVVVEGGDWLTQTVGDCCFTAVVYVHSVLRLYLIKMTYCMLYIFVALKWPLIGSLFVLLDSNSLLFSKIPARTVHIS